MVAVAIRVETVTGHRTSAHDYWDDHVAPALQEWRDDPTNLRRAMVAALILHHVTDHYWGSYSTTEPARVFERTKNARRFRNELARRHPDYALLRDVADAHKHMTLDRGDRQVTDASQTDMGSIGYGQGRYNAGPYGGGPSVIIELDDGSKRHLSAVVDAVEAMWSSMLP